MILTGDIGGTKTVLCLISIKPDGLLLCEKEETYSSADFPDFNALLTAFIPAGIELTSACFGVAGPVVNQRCQTTNLPWVLDAIELKNKLGVDKLKLLNDLEAMALGMLHLPESDLVELNPAAKAQTGNKAVIAAGTGLGEAILFLEDLIYHPIATEGGHSDFAAQTAEQDQLLVYLREKFPDHVSWERVLCGNGFSLLYDFFVGRRGDVPPSPAVPVVANNEVDRNAIISQLGVQGKDPLCNKAVDLFVDLYGAEAGNLALKSLATGGVYIGGGIAPKILPALQTGRFIEAFKAKGRFSGLLSTISVKLSLNPRTPLLGALNAAIQLNPDLRS